MFRKITVFLFLLFFCINIGVIDAQEKSSRGEVSPKLKLGGKQSRWVSIFSIRATVETFVLNPRDPNSIYALASPYGIFENTDGEKFWEPVWKTVPLWSATSGAYDVVTRIVRFDPLNPNTIYISISRSTRPDVVTFKPISEGKLFKSKDRGKTWEDIPSILQKSVIRDVAIHPKSPEIIYAATTDGLFKTLNGGKTWGKILEGKTWNKELSQVFLNPELPEEIYAVGAGNLYYSKDGGENFNNITPAIPLKEWRVTREELKGVRQVFYATLNSHNPLELFVIGKGRDTTDILKSTDKGQSWQVVSEWRYEDYKMSAYASPPIVEPLVFHPTDRDVIYTIETGNSILKSTDGGKTWMHLSTPFSKEISDIAKIHAPSSSFEYVRISDISVPSPSTLYVATNYGVYKTIDEGKTWVLTGFGLPSVPRESLWGIDSYKKFTYVGDYLGPVSENYSGYWLSSDRGLTWDWYFSPDNYRIRQLITARDGITYIVSDKGRVFKFTPDGKRSELKFPFGLSYLRGVHSNSQVLYAVAMESVFGIRGSLFKSEDGGFSWTKIDIKGEQVEKGVRRAWGWTDAPKWYSIDLLAVDPQSPNTFYITVGPNNSSKGAIFKTSDGGKSWIDITDNLGFVPDSIVIDSFDSKVLYAGAVRSDDGGKTWKPIKPKVDGLGINSIAVHPLNSKILYIATNKGVYRSSDSGNTWQSLNNGLLEDDIQEVMISSDMVLIRGKKTGIYKLME